MAKKGAQQKRAAAKRKRREARKRSKTPHPTPDPRPSELLTVPVWEYDTVATTVMLESSEQLGYHEVLDYLFSVPIYIGEPGGKPRAGRPQDLMAAGDATAEEFLDLMQTLYRGGLIEWDQDNLVHILSMPPK